MAYAKQNQINIEQLGEIHPDDDVQLQLQKLEKSWAKYKDHAD